MLVLRFVARPSPVDPAPGGVAGAYINCWVGTESLAHAQVLARRAIRAEGWAIEKLEEVTRAERADYAGRAESLEHYDIASKHGLYLVIHLWRSRKRARAAARTGKLVRKRAAKRSRAAKKARP
jgi:hypothetical protein